MNSDRCNNNIILTKNPLIDRDYESLYIIVIRPTAVRYDPGFASDLGHSRSRGAFLFSALQNKLQQVHHA